MSACTGIFCDGTFALCRVFCDADFALCRVLRWDFWLLQPGSSFFGKRTHLPKHIESDLCIDCKNSSFRGYSVKDYISERAVRIANYIIQNNATVRQTAQSFGVSKSTVHKDVAERLLYINPHLAAEARKVLDVNKSERHIRGGLATREKYLHQHQLQS